jgi:hypothetical protein
LSWEGRRIFWIYSTASVFVSVLIRYTSSLIQPSCCTKINIHRPHRTQVYNSVVVTFNYRGFFGLLAPYQCVPHVTCSYLIIMLILQINSAEQNAQYRSVNEHKSVRQYRLTVTTHEQQNTGETSEHHMCTVY